MPAKKKIKAIALISGGLDSLLAAKVIMNQGIHVEGINFYSGFFGVSTKLVTLKKDEKKEKYNSATWVAKQLGIKLHVIDIFAEFKPILLKPKHGYGANLNPCLDCKTFLVAKTKHWLLQHNFDFIITGEVVGQRPMSQRADTLPIVAKESAADDLLLRPLCAKNLSPTKPETAGWVNREQLYGFNGRSRKPQIALAKEFGFNNFPAPAGGCLLTDKQYCARLNDIWQAKEERNYTKTDIDLLKVGRHLRPKPNFKLIIGREQAENKFLKNFKAKFIYMHPLDIAGPLVLIDGKVNASDLKLAAEITARYSKSKPNNKTQVKVVFTDQTVNVLQVYPLLDEQITASHWHV